MQHARQASSFVCGRESKVSGGKLRSIGVPFAFSPLHWLLTGLLPSKRLLRVDTAAARRAHRFEASQSFASRQRQSTQHKRSDFQGRATSERRAAMRTQAVFRSARERLAERTLWSARSSLKASTGHFFCTSSAFNFVTRIHGVAELLSRSAEHGEIPIRRTRTVSHRYPQPSQVSRTALPIRGTHQRRRFRDQPREPWGVHPQKQLSRVSSLVASQTHTICLSTQYG